MKKNKLKVLILLLILISLTACVEDTAMHLTGEQYTHKDSADERQVNVIPDQLGLTSLGKNTKSYDAYFTSKSLLEDFTNSTDKLGSDTGGSDGIYTQEGYLIFPVETAKYTSQYGWRGLRGKSDYHSGDDFGVPVGSKLYASLTGKVVDGGLGKASACHPTAGCHITIEGELGGKKLRVAYLHLQKQTGLKEGDAVTAGQHIGYTGNTGNSTGPHLHVEVMIPDTYLHATNGRLIAGGMYGSEDLKGLKKEWWWNKSNQWSRIKPASYFKETEGKAANSQTITRTSKTPVAGGEEPPTNKPPTSTDPKKSVATNYKSATGVSKADVNASIVQNTDSDLIVVNKTNKLKDTYVPAQLVNVVSGTHRKGKTEKMVSHAAVALNNMITAMEKEGIEVGVRSGYRSHAEQVLAFDGNGKDETISSKPGYSEHQTGLAVDLVEKTQINLSGTTALSQSNVTNKKLYDYLKDNSHKYGFIIRFPEDKTSLTGYAYEPWHIRYIGVDEATALKSKGWALEEAIEKGFFPL